LFSRSRTGCSQPEKGLIAQTQQGQLDVSWLDLLRNPHFQIPIRSPNLFQRKTFIKVLVVLFPEQSSFDYKQLKELLAGVKVERIKGVINTNQGWFIINGVDNNISYISIASENTSRIEVIVRGNGFKPISKALTDCLE